MKIGLAPIALRSYRGGDITKPWYKNNIANMLTRVKGCGYEGIEMGTPPGFTNEEFKELLDTAGLTAVSAGGMGYPALQAEDFSAKLEECRILGAENVMVGSPPHIVMGNPAELDKFIAHLNRVGKILMEGGEVHLSYHTHAIDFSKIYGTKGPIVLDYILENTDPRYVFIEPDTHWITAGGGHVILWLRKLRGRMFRVHFKDYAIDPYSDHTYLECTHKLFAEVGEGNLNWLGIIAECLAQDIGWCAVEQDVTYRPPFESIRLSVENLHKYGL
jgi:sugar phosphate isomerase/epimerase